MAIVGIIRARYASRRFPGNRLAEIRGVSMLARVYAQAKKARHLGMVVVATDDQRIADHAEHIGAPWIMTGTSHVSGTDRCWEAYQLLKKEFTHIINIQGDEPFLDPEQIDS